MYVGEMNDNVERFEVRDKECDQKESTERTGYR